MFVYIFLKGAAVVKQFGFVKKCSFKILSCYLQGAIFRDYGTMRL
jgi:hypothetical protein